MATMSCTCLFKSERERYWLKCWKAILETKLGLCDLVQTELESCRKCAVEKLNKNNPCRIGLLHGKCDQSLRQLYCLAAPTRNTDQNQWCSSLCEYAKCFIVSPGYRNTKNINDLDLNGFFNIIMNCCTFQNYFGFQLSDKSQIFQQVNTN